MKRIRLRKLGVALCLLVLLISPLLIPAVKVQADDVVVSREINLVYDNSGSMYSGKDGALDTWCQAKYSMEVFASMLGEKDTLNIYYMSDFDKDTSAAPQIVLKGSDGAKANIASIHDHTCEHGWTPMNSVIKAYDDLKSSGADEKWLVILTDGVLNVNEGGNHRDLTPAEVEAEESSSSEAHKEEALA